MVLSCMQVRRGRSYAFVGMHNYRIYLGQWVGCLDQFRV